MQLGAKTMSCLNTLKEHGLRLTPQRRMIVDIIHDKGEHLTAEDIIKYVQGKMPGVNKSTIYRTLELLEQTGCVIKSESENHFIYHHAEEGHHHHLVCRKCGKTIECGNSLFLPIEKSLADEYGFKVKFEHMVINGLCKTCKNQL
jgi:Fur family transcriptional regulator, ferric uptake regulator